MEGVGRKALLIGLCLCVGNVFECFVDTESHFYVYCAIEYASCKCVPAPRPHWVLEKCGVEKFRLPLIRLS